MAAKAVLVPSCSDVITVSTAFLIVSTAPHIAL